MLTMSAGIEKSIAKAARWPCFRVDCTACERTVSGVEIFSAWNPFFSTAFTTSSRSILSVLQVMLAFSNARLTRTDSTPGTLETTDSTDATQEEQVIPLTRSVDSVIVIPLCCGHSLLIISIDVRQETGQDVQTISQVLGFDRGRVVQVVE